MLWNVWRLFDLKALCLNSKSLLVCCFMLKSLLSVNILQIYTTWIHVYFHVMQFAWKFVNLAIDIFIMDEFWLRNVFALKVILSWRYSRRRSTLYLHSRKKELTIILGYFFFQTPKSRYTLWNLSKKVISISILILMQ